MTKQAFLGLKSLLQALNKPCIFSLLIALAEILSYIRVIFSTPYTQTEIAPLPFMTEDFVHYNEPAISAYPVIMACLSLYYVALATQ